MVFRTTICNGFKFFNTFAGCFSVMFCVLNTGETFQFLLDGVTKRPSRVSSFLWSRGPREDVFLQVLSEKSGHEYCWLLARRFWQLYGVYSLFCPLVSDLATLPILGRGLSRRRQGHSRHGWGGLPFFFRSMQKVMAAHSFRSLRRLFLYFPTRRCGVSGRQRAWFSQIRRRVRRFYFRSRRRQFFKSRGVFVARPSRPRLRIRRFYPQQVRRRFRFVKKVRALFSARALHTNLFFTIRQGMAFFSASTGFFDDLRRGTKRKRTLMAGWFLADRLFSRVEGLVRPDALFALRFYGRTSGRRGVWFSWRTKRWRLFHVSSRTPIAFNGTRACRRRRL